jgi:hypothetical protein
MGSSRTTIVSLFMGISLIVYFDDAVPQVCATLQTYNPDYPVAIQAGSGGQDWNWPNTGSFILNQNSNGIVDGGLQNAGPCPDNYNTTGVMNNQGGFSLTSNDEVSPSLGCAQTLNMSGTVNGGAACPTENNGNCGCTVASGTWNNSSGLNGSFSMSHGCFVPSGETNQVFKQWAEVTNGSTVNEAAVFQLQLSPLTFNWGGRTVSETFPQPAVDGCWFPGSAVPKLTTIATKSVTVDSNAIYTDSIGPVIGSTYNAVAYYRNKGRTPCSLTTQQVMVIDCPNPPANPTYATNTQIDTIGPRLLTVSRGNNPPVSEVFGAPAPALTLPAWILNLVFPPKK